MTGPPPAVDPLLAVPLPRDGPGPPSRLAGDLDTTATRLGRLAGTVGSAASHDGWSGPASAAAARRLRDCAAVLALEQRRSRMAGEALSAFSREVVAVAQLVDETGRLLGAARGAQHRADERDPEAAARDRLGTSGHRLDGTIRAPEAVVLLRRARATAVAACQRYDRAAASLAAELAALSGRRVVRHAPDARLAVDVASLVPLVGTVVTVYDVVDTVSRHDWHALGVTVAAAAPRCVGTVFTGVTLAQSIARLGSVARVERLRPSVPVVDVLRAEAR